MFELKKRAQNGLKESKMIDKNSNIYMWYSLHIT